MGRPSALDGEVEVPVTDAPEARLASGDVTADVDRGLHREVVSAFQAAEVRVPQVERYGVGVGRLLHNADEGLHALAGDAVRHLAGELLHLSTLELHEGPRRDRQARECAAALRCLQQLDDDLLIRRVDQGGGCSMAYPHVVAARFALES